MSVEQKNVGKTADLLRPSLVVKSRMLYLISQEIREAKTLERVRDRDVARSARAIESTEYGKMGNIGISRAYINSRVTFQEHTAISTS